VTRLADVICAVGADRGKGTGFTELYFTQKDGSLEKVARGHGLHKYPTMRTRLAVKLRDTQDDAFFFMSTTNGIRNDKMPNEPRMFKNIFKKEKKKPYFKEVL
jgi:hypothetical protein